VGSRKACAAAQNGFGDSVDGIVLNDDAHTADQPGCPTANGKPDLSDNALVQLIGQMQQALALRGRETRNRDARPA